MAAHKMAFIFDMDGVLLDSMGSYYKSFHKVFKEEFGVEVSRELHLSLAGQKNLDVLRNIAKALGVQLHDEDRLIRNVEAYCESIINEAHPIEENVTLARLLLDHGVPVACASGGPESIVRASLALCGLSDVTACITSDQVTHGKPDPECFLKAAEAMGVDPECCIVVEDAQAGIQAAKAAGMKAMHYFRQGLFPC